MSLFAHLKQIGEEAADKELTVKMTVTVPGGLLLQVDTWAEELGFNRSALVTELLRISIEELDEEMAKAERKAK